MEHLGHQTAERIERAVTTVIVWWPAAMTLLRGEALGLPGEVLVTSIQMRVLRHFAARRNLTAPEQSGSGRADDGHPGWLPLSQERSATRKPEDPGRLDLARRHGRRV